MSLFGKRSNKSMFGFRNYGGLFLRAIDKKIKYTHFMYGKFSIKKS